MTHLDGAEADGDGRDLDIAELAGQLQQEDKRVIRRSIRRVHVEYSQWGFLDRRLGTEADGKLGKEKVLEPFEGMTYHGAEATVQVVGAGKLSEEDTHRKRETGQAMRGQYLYEIGHVRLWP